MLQIEPLLKKPDDLEEALLPASLAELQKVDMDLAFRIITPDGWIVRNNDQLIFVLGFVKTGSIIGANTEVWLLVCRGAEELDIAAWRVLRRHFQQAVRDRGRVTARVSTDFQLGKHFARFFGFRYTHTSDQYDFYGAT